MGVEVVICNYMSLNCCQQEGVRSYADYESIIKYRNKTNECSSLDFFLYCDNPLSLEKPQISNLVD